MARRSFTTRIALLLATTAVALLLAEGLFRAFGPRLGGYGPPVFLTPTGLKVPMAEIVHFLGTGGFDSGSSRSHPSNTLKPSLHVREQYDHPRWAYFDADGCIDVHHNSLGFRDEEFPIAKPAGEFRVLAIGDSFTWGNGVRAEDAWPAVLEDELRARGGATASAQVVNCGFAGGYDATGYAPWLRSDGLLLDPDLVVVGFCLNDMEGRTNDVPMLSYAAPEPADGLAWCRILQYAMWTKACRAARRDAKDFAAVVRQHPKRWNATQAALRDMKAACAEKGVGFAVAIFPMLSQLDVEPWPYAGLVTMVRDFCREAGIRCVDTSPEFVGRTDELDLWAHVTDQHPNDVGQRMLAEQVFRFLVGEGLLPK
ncbi:MAG: hypothetical protein KDE27_19860 [Planctomycetes bacterium]|nr:hypothetical protein [Planctomycetota bacterium]